MHLLSNQPSYLDPSDSNTSLILFQRYLHSLDSVKTGFSNGPHTKEECNNPGEVLKWTVMVTLTVIGDSSTDIIPVPQ